MNDGLIVSVVLLVGAVALIGALLTITKERDQARRDAHHWLVQYQAMRKEAERRGWRQLTCTALTATSKIPIFHPKFGFAEEHDDGTPEKDPA